MVWDTLTGTSAQLHGIAMDELSESLAERFAERLNEKISRTGMGERTKRT